MMAEPRVDREVRKFLKIVGIARRTGSSWRRHTRVRSAHNLIYNRSSRTGNLGG